MTARVTSSASDSLGAIPTAGRQGARCGAVFSRSSVVTYSAVARVSRSASTGPPRLDVGFATPILDALLRLRIWPLGGRKLRPLGIGHLAVHTAARHRHLPEQERRHHRRVGVVGNVAWDCGSPNAFRHATLKVLMRVTGPTPMVASRSGSTPAARSTPTVHAARTATRRQ